MVIAAICLLDERSVDEIVAKLSPVELEQVIKIVGRSPRGYAPGAYDALKGKRNLAQPQPPTERLALSPPAAGPTRGGVRLSLVDPDRQEERWRTPVGSCENRKVINARNASVVGCVSVKATSSPDRSEKVVNPTISVKRTVTCLRSASIRLSRTQKIRT